MRILSWNILFSSRNLDEAYAFIERTNADIVCLQEVPASFLERLRKLPYYAVAAPETDRWFRRVKSTEYVVILTRYQIFAEGSFPIPSSEPHEPLRTRLVSKLMNLFNMWARGCGNRHGVFADMEISYGVVIRVINVHLSLTYPSRRASEFALVSRSLHETRPNIICGDFNVIESGKMSILNWLLGGLISDVTNAKRERLAMEAAFRNNGLINPLKGLVTHPLSASQLDHILVPENAKVKEARVVKERYGSDHNPVIVELA